MAVNTTTNFPTKRDPLDLAEQEYVFTAFTFPTTKTVPLDKDIGVFNPLPYLGTTTRMQLSSILLAVDEAFKSLREDTVSAYYTEQSARVAAVNDLQNQLDVETTARISADDTERTARIANDNLEISMRSAAVSALQAAILGDREPLSVTFVSGASYKVEDAFAYRKSVSDGSSEIAVSVVSGAFQSDFNGAIIDFNAQNITYIAGGQLGTPAISSFTRPSLTGQANKWTKAAVILLPTAPDTLLIGFTDTFASTAAAVPSPAVTGGIPVGIIALQVNSSATGFNTGNIGNVTKFLDSSSSDIGFGAASPLDPNIESSFLYHTRSDFSVDKKNFFLSTTGSDQILGLAKVILNSGQNLISSDLTGTLIRKDNKIVNAAQVTLIYQQDKYDSSPIIQLSLNGGSTWTSAQSPLTLNEGNMVVADFSLPVTTTALFETTSNNSTTTSGTKVAAVISPSHRMVLTGFKAKIKTSATSGYVNAKLYTVASNVPQTLVAASSETYYAVQDITSTAAYQLFTFPPTTLEPGTKYALSLESTGMGSNLSWNQATGAGSIAASAAADIGSGWTAIPGIYLDSQLFGQGLDVCLKITSGTNNSELLGFGVDMVLENAPGYSGDSSWEERVITGVEAATGLIKLVSCQYVPGAHQLHANVNGHDFIAPDFTEVGTNTVKFPEGFFQEGDVVRFYTGYGLVDSSAISLQKINTVYEAVVGSTAQVASGVANFSSLQSAINAVVPGGKIVVLQGTYTENITINKEICIHGKGRSSILNGTVSFGSSSTGSMLKYMKILDNVTINNSAQAIYVSDNWLASGKTVTGGTNCFILNIGE